MVEARKSLRNRRLLEATELFDSWDPEKWKSLADVEKQFKTNCLGVENVIIHRFKFWTRSQSDGETFSSYYQELRRLVNDCKYENMKNEMLRDRILVCVGIRSDTLCERLFREKNPTLEQVIELLETAEVLRSQVHHVN